MSREIIKGGRPPKNPDVEAFKELLKAIVEKIKNMPDDGEAEVERKQDKK
ncbi:MAG: hypothetical protein Q7S03_03655 [bacterium]|nr:hypothetical protein [bacterium]